MPSYPPRWSPPQGDHIKRRPERFTTNLAIGGVEVIDFDGRPIITCETPAESRAIASDLNDAAFAGPTHLIAELKALA